MGLATNGVLTIGTTNFVEVREGEYIQSNTNLIEPIRLYTANTIGKNGLSSFVLKFQKTEVQPTTGVSKTSQFHEVFKPTDLTTMDELIAFHTLANTFWSVAGNRDKVLLGLL